MLSLPIYLYPNTLSVILDLDPTTRGVNNVMYQRDLVIQKGVKNKIRIQFKNSDQKLLPISNTGTYVFTMFNATDQRQLFEKLITVLDDSFTASTIQDQTTVGNTLSFNTATNVTIGQTITGFGIAPNSVVIGYSSGTVTLNQVTTYPVTSSTTLTLGTVGLRGTGELVLTESNTLNLDVGEYQYSIKYVDPDLGGYAPVYSNTYYGITGTLTLKDDIYPKLQPSLEVDTFLSRFNTVSSLYEWFSGNLYAHPEFNETGGALHTVAIYMTNYKGTVTFQGTLSNQPDSSVVYDTLETRTYDGFTGIDYINSNGIYSYVRIIYTPATKPGDSTNDNPSYYGSLDKVLYRS